MQINRANLTALEQNFRAVYVKAFQGGDPDWPKIAMRVPSMSAAEFYQWLGAMPGMKELVGKAVIENLTANEFTIVNKEWESTVAVKRAAIERDQIGLYSPMMSALGQTAARHPDELVAGLLNNGFTLGVGTDYTTKAFFAAAKKHNPNDSKAGTFTNNGVAVLDAASYSVAKANLKARKNANGKSMKLGKKLLLVVPPALEDTAIELLVAERDAAGATNIQKGTAEWLVLPDLTSDTAWFLLDVGHEVKPLIYQEEVAPEFVSQTDPQAEGVFLSKEFAYQAYGRYNAGYGLPQLAYGSTGAGA